MNQRIVVGLVLLVVAIGALIAAGVAWVSVALYADATGTGGYIPPVSWITAISGLIALVAGIAVLNGRAPSEPG